MVHQVREYLVYQDVFALRTGYVLLFSGGVVWGIFIVLLVAWRAPSSQAARVFIVWNLVVITMLLTSLSPSGLPSSAQRVVWAATASCQMFLCVWFTTLFPEPWTLRDIARLEHGGGGWLHPFRTVARRLSRFALRRKWVFFAGTVSVLVFVTNFAQADGRYEQSGTVGIGLGRTPEPQGSVVQYVSASGPAYVSGLRVGDVVQAVNGHGLANPLEGEAEGDTLSSNQRLIAVLQTVQPGDTARFDYLRGGSAAVAMVELVAWTAPVHFLLWYRGRWFAPVWPLTVVTLLLGVVALAMLWSGYRLADLAGRRKVLWIFLGFVVWFCTATMMVTVAVAGLLRDIPGMNNIGLTLDAFGAFGFWGGLSIAVLSKGAFDAKPLVTKTTIYGMLAVLVLALFVAVESILSELLEARVGLPGMGGAIVSGLVVGALAFPLRRVLSTRVAQWFGSTEPGDGVQPTPTSSHST